MRACSANFGNILTTMLASVTCYKGKVRMRGPSSAVYDARL